MAVVGNSTDVIFGGKSYNSLCLKESYFSRLF